MCDSRELLQSKGLEWLIIMKELIFFILATVISVSVSSDILKLFESDGCSAFPDGTSEQNELWLSCCHKHDLAYWRGGTYKARLESDRALESCVTNVGEPEIALLMLAGVRVGGTPFLPTKFRWAMAGLIQDFMGSSVDQSF